MFPPLCPRCETQHINHCEDAAFERELWVAMGNRIRAGLAALSRTPMANVPPTLRGPRWRAR